MISTMRLPLRDRPGGETAFRRPIPGARRGPAARSGSSSVPRPSVRRFAAVSSSCGQAASLEGRFSHSRFVTKKTRTARPAGSFSVRADWMNSTAPGTAGAFRSATQASQDAGNASKQVPSSSSRSLGLRVVEDGFVDIHDDRGRQCREVAFLATAPRSRMDLRVPSSGTRAQPDRPSRSPRDTRRNCASRAWRDRRPRRMSGPKGRAMLSRRQRADSARSRRQRRGPRCLRSCTVATALRVLIQSTTRVPPLAVRFANSAARRSVIGPMAPLPILRPSTCVTPASSPMVPVQKASSAR